ncbi:MAG: Rpn family recombination-promoting nuclease/putative transposase [Treponemataceae bacterium]|nr:Rpn family recombination-promoting nuclease/putative transposase [Treponemataceae bacterium]
MKKSYDELTFTDDFLFSRIMQDEEICKGVIEVLLGIQVERIEYLNAQQEKKFDMEAHGVRFDVYVKDSDRIFDIEIQTEVTDELLKRGRYYQSMIDIDSLYSGQSYRDLKESYVIFICLDDPFDLKYPVYTFKRGIVEAPPEAMFTHDDETSLVFYNTSAWAKSEKPELKMFLKYLKTNTAAEESPLVSSIDRAVRHSKRNEKWRRNFMTLAMKLEEAREKGREEGREEGLEAGLKAGLEEGLEEGAAAQRVQDTAEFAQRLVKMGLSAEQICEATGLSAEDVEKLKAATLAG